MEPRPDAGQMPAMGPRKQANYIADLLHWAEFSGVELSPKGKDLMKTDARPALRAALVAQEMGCFADFHPRAYRARWCEGRDLSKPEELEALFREAGADASAALARVDDPELQDLLDVRTREAVERGVFGVPTLFVGDEMFWGNDRFELARYYLDKLAS